MSLTPGASLGPYEILALVGAGGMGEVWKARDTRLNRIVAVKRLTEQHSGRFEQEARAIAALNHPHICQIYDVGADYLVLEFVDGHTLADRIRTHGGPGLPQEEARRIARQITEGLEEAHRAGILHRDLKPGNVMITDQGLDEDPRFRPGESGQRGSRGHTDAGWHRWNGRIHVAGAGRGPTG